MTSAYAQTIIQLHQQLRAQGYPLADQCRVRDAYALATVLFTTRQQSSGKSFMAHVTGTASILATMDVPGEVVAAGLVHNAYRTGDFGDGARGPSAARRALLQRTLGADVEGYVARFATLHWNPVAIADYRERLAALDPVDLQVLRIRIADLLEHLLDGGPTLGDAQERRFVERGPGVAALAAALGHPHPADDITRALAEITAAAPATALVGHGSPRLCTPRSYRPRRLLVLAQRRGFRWALPWLHPSLRRPLVRRSDLAPPDARRR